MGIENNISGMSRMYFLLFPSLDYNNKKKNHLQSSSLSSESYRLYTTDSYTHSVLLRSLGVVCPVIKLKEIRTSEGAVEIFLFLQRDWTLGLQSLQGGSLSCVRESWHVRSISLTFWLNNSYTTCGATDLINWAANIFPSQEVKDRSGFANNNDHLFILAMFYRPFE